MAETSDPSGATPTKTSGAATMTTTGPSIISTAEDPAVAVSVALPRITIRYCTQCKWMLRAAYLAQELLSTFSTALGEVALQPSTGGTFVIEILVSNSAPAADPATSPTDSSQQRRITTTPAAAAATTTKTLWDRKVDGGFPETKELKRRVRDVIEPGRNLGHVDKDYHPKLTTTTTNMSDIRPPRPENLDSRSWRTPGPQPNDEGRQQQEEKGVCEDCK